MINLSTKGILLLHTESKVAEVSEKKQTKSLARTRNVHMVPSSLFFNIAYVYPTQVAFSYSQDSTTDMYAADTGNGVHDKMSAH